MESPGTFPRVIGYAAANIAPVIFRHITSNYFAISDSVLLNQNVTSALGGIRLLRRGKSGIAPSVWMDLLPQLISVFDEVLLAPAQRSVWGRAQVVMEGMSISAGTIIHLAGCRMRRW